MVFSSPSFLFFFLPLCLIAYLLAPPRWRNAVLVVASVVFYVWGEQFYIILLAASLGVNFAFGLAVARRAEASSRRRAVGLGIAFNLILLGVFKYPTFIVGNLNHVFGTVGLPPVSLPHIVLPLGISFITFHSISYLVDIYRRTSAPQRHPLNYALYILLFPQLIAGPIIRYHDIAHQLVNRLVTQADLLYGIQRFIVGLGKKMIIGNTVGRVADQIFVLPAGELTAPVAWLGLSCYALQIYFDFSGYSDMAIGLCRMFGFRVLENFKLPYTAQSVREFWRRWHVSLSNWFRDYLYIPLGGNRRGEIRTYLNLLTVFFLCGLWHGASWTFVVWGLFHGAFLAFEHAGGARLIEQLWRPLRHGYALLVAMLGWVLFRADSFDHALAYYRALFGLSIPDNAVISVAEYLNGAVAAAIIAGLMLSTPLWYLVRRLLWDPVSEDATPGPSQSRLLTSLARGVCLAGIFVIVAMLLAAGTYNPFIYFRF